MITNYTFSNAPLKGKIKEVYGTIGSFADAFGISRTAMSTKINKYGSAWRVEDAFKAAALLGISPNDSHEFMRVFYAVELTKK